MSSNYDKSLDEIVRAKGIKNPTSMKSKHRNPYFQKNITKKGFWKKVIQGDRNFDVEQKCLIKLSGLAATVSWADLQELFSPFSPTGSRIDVKMHYDSSGKYLGSAEIAMPNRKMAIRACQEYNNVDLDDFTMSAVVVGHEDGNRLVVDDVAPKNKNKTAQELNEELDQYFRQKSNSQGPVVDDEIPRITRNNPVPKFYRRNEHVAREMASIDELDAEIEEYMEKNGKLDDGGSD